MNRAIVLLLISFSFVYSQLPQSSGNLLHINVNQDTVSLSDTLGFWQNGINDYHSKYRNIIRLQDSVYFIREQSYTPEYVLGYYSVAIENSISGNRRDFIYNSATDMIGLYNIRPNIYELSNGLWIFDDVYGNGFLSQSDSFYVNDIEDSNYLYHISGKVDSLHFVIWNENYNLKFYLMDLSESPSVDTSSVINLNFDYSDKPIRIEHFSDHLYFIQTSKGLNLYKFQADSFQYIKNVLANTDYSNMCFKQNQLYAYENSKLIKHELNLTDTTFFDGEVLLEGDIYVDRKYEYAVKIDSSSVYLYDITNESTLKTWDISGLSYCFKPLIDYPDIYFHQTTNITTISHRQTLPQKILFVKAYPNPFNSSIVFQLENILNRKVGIKIYDIRGRLVKQFDKDKIGNSHQIIWRPNSLSSGIYSAVIEDGLRRQQIKVCYIK